MLPVSLDCSFLIAPSVFSDVYFNWSPANHSYSDNMQFIYLNISFCMLGTTYTYVEEILELDRYIYNIR